MNKFNSESMEEQKQQIANRFAAVISTRRKQYGWTVYEVSKRTGLHASLIARIESGENIPRLDTAVKICEVLNLQVVLTNDLKLV